MHALEYILFFLACCLSAGLLGILRKSNPLIKLLFANSTAVLSTLLLCTLGSFKANSSYLDIAIIYFLLSYIASLGYLRYFLKTYQSD